VTFSPPGPLGQKDCPIHPLQLCCVELRFRQLTYFFLSSIGVLTSWYTTSNSVGCEAEIRHGRQAFSLFSEVLWVPVVAAFRFPPGIDFFILLFWQLVFFPPLSSLQPILMYEPAPSYVVWPFFLLFSATSSHSLPSQFFVLFFFVQSRVRQTQLQLTPFGKCLLVGPCPKKKTSPPSCPPWPKISLGPRADYSFVHD